MARVNGKIALGVSRCAPYGTENLAPGAADTITAIEEFKTANNGVYPAIWGRWSNFGKPDDYLSGADIFIPALATLNAYGDRGVVPKISAQPVGDEIIREDRLFRYDSSSTSPSGIASGKIRFNSTNPALVTEMYISNTSACREKKASQGGTLMPANFTNWRAGDKVVATLGVLVAATASNPNPTKRHPLIYKNAFQNKSKTGGWAFTLTLVSVTDNGTYTTVAVSGAGTVANRPNAMFANNARVWIGLGVSQFIDETYSNAAIAAGSHDDYLDALAARFQEYNKKILYRFAFEMNGSWFPWSYGLSGATQTTSRRNYYEGDAYFRGFLYYNMGNNASNFKDMWRHVHSKLASDKVKFVYCIINGSGDEKAAKAAAMYPGAAYVDYNGIDIYNWKPLSGGASFYSQASAACSTMRPLGMVNNVPKDVIVCEWGVASYLENPCSGPAVATSKLFAMRDETDPEVGEELTYPDRSVSTDPVVLYSASTSTATSAITLQQSARATWLVNAFQDTLNRLPLIVAMIYFDIDVQCWQGVDWRLQSAPTIWPNWRTWNKKTAFRGTI